MNNPICYVKNKKMGLSFPINYKPSSICHNFLKKKRIVASPPERSLNIISVSQINIQ